MLSCGQDKTKHTYSREPQGGAIILQTKEYKTENRLGILINQQVQLKLDVNI